MAGINPKISMVLKRIIVFLNLIIIKILQFYLIPDFNLKNIIFHSSMIINYS